MSGDMEKDWIRVSTQELYNLYQSTTNRNLFQVRLKASGGYLRRRFNAESIARAAERAPVVAGLKALAGNQGVVSLSEAFTMALQATSRGERSRRDWVDSVEKFLVWLKEKHPLCVHWGLLTRQILRGYLNQYEGKSANYRRLMMQPILQTAGFMHREFDHPDIGSKLGVGGKLKTTPKSVYLADVKAFCDHVRENRPHLEAGVCLQGLAGLQLLEALRLTWDKVDLSRGLIEISGEVKNEYRNRVIPVVKPVREALERAWDSYRAKSGRVVDLYQFVVVGEKGNGFEDHCSYGRQVRAALLAWNPACDWAPKDLRNCLLTFSMMEGTHGTIWEQYVGHAPRTVTERHYVPRLASKTSGESAALDRQMATFRKMITEPVERAMLQQLAPFLQLTRTAKVLDGR